MRTRTYKLATIGIATLDNAAVLVVQQNGWISAIRWHGDGTAGAAVGRMTHELSFTPAQQLEVNDSIGPIDSFGIGYGVANATFHNDKVSTGFMIEVRSGDRLILSNVLTGTAPASQRLQCYVDVSF